MGVSVQWLVMAGHAVILVATLLLCFQSTSGQFPQAGTQYSDRIPCLDKSKPDVYGRKLNDQVEVELDMDIVDISTLDVVEEEISVEINLVQSWTDTRCRYESEDYEQGYVIFQGSDTLTMWTPDTYISNAVSSSAPKAPKPQKSTRIYKSGLIVQKERLSLTISCPLNIRDFPFDMENCVIKFESYAYPLTEVKYKWKTYSNGSTIRIQSRKQADINLVQLLPFEKQKTVNGEMKSYLRLRMFLERPIGYYLSKFYFPLVFLVHFSWITFFMGRGVMPARVMVAVTALMTINSLYNTIETKLPKTTSITAIGVYMWACFFFAIASFVQTASVIYTDKLKKTIEENIKEDKQTDVDLEKQLGISANAQKSAHWNPLLTIFKFNIHMKRNKSKKRKRSRIEQIARDPKVLRVLRPSKIDVYSRFIFPATFYVLNVVYWVYYIYIIEQH